MNAEKLEQIQRGQTIAVETLQAVFDMAEQFKLPRGEVILLCAIEFLAFVSVLSDKPPAELLRLWSTALDFRVKQHRESKGVARERWERSRH